MIKRMGCRASYYWSKVILKLIQGYIDDDTVKLDPVVRRPD